MSELIPPPLPEPLTWKAAAEHCLTLADMTSYQKEKARRALIYLGDVLGEEMWKQPHPMSGYVYNFAPWSRLALTRYADELRALEGALRLDTLIERIRSPTMYGEGMSVLRASSRLKSQGFLVEFDPAATVRGGPKKPDLLISNRDVDDEIYVEVATLGPSKAEEEAYKAFESVTRLFFGTPRIEYAGRMLRTPSPQGLAQIMRRIGDAISKCKETGHFQEVIIPNVIELAVAGRDDAQFLRDWKADRKVQGFSGPGTTPDTLNRIKGKIRNEQKQLPRDKLGAIVLDVQRSWFVWEEDQDTLENLRDFGELVAEFPHVLSIALCSEVLAFNTTADTRQSEGQVFARHATRTPFAESLYLLTNRYCTLKLAPATMTAWTRAFLP